MISQVNKKADKCMHPIIWNCVGKVYDPQKHSPYIGSILYTLFTIILYYLLSIFLKNLFLR